MRLTVTLVALHMPVVMLYRLKHSYLIPIDRSSSPFTTSSLPGCPNRLDVQNGDVGLGPKHGDGDGQVGCARGLGRERGEGL